MTTPAPCPHCGRRLAYNPAQHVALCPANPAMHDAYRAALEDPDNPGTVRQKDDYEATRGELYSGTILIRCLRCGWSKVGGRYGLTHAQQARKPINWIGKQIGRIGAEIDAEIERNRAADAEAGQDVGLPVVGRGREVVYGGKVYLYFEVR